jgi:DNA-directed RNA polymerase subunit RPC12/RpoP
MIYQDFTCSQCQHHFVLHEEDDALEQQPLVRCPWCGSSQVEQVAGGRSMALTKPERQTPANTSSDWTRAMSFTEVNEGNEVEQ